MPRHDESVIPALSRRELVVGGGLLLGGLALSGCSSNKKSGGAYNTPGGDPGDDAYVAQMQPSPGSVPSNLPGNIYAPQPAWAQTVPNIPTELPVYTPPAPTAPQGPAVVIPRSTWTRMGVARPREIYSIGSINRITIHHDGMPPAAMRSTRDVAMRLEQIRAAHVNGRGWADIGYHYIVDPSGRVWEGRNIAYQGAHVKDQNENNLGILVLGNFEIQRPSPQALSTLDRFVVFNMQRYRIPLGRVRTHREMAQTDCPGRNLQSYMLASRAGGGAIALNAARAGLARG